MTDIQDFLKGGDKVPGGFNRDSPIGAVCKGTIVDLDVRQAIDFDSQQPATWPDGNPKMNLVITLQTDERDPSIPDDDGRRRLYALKPSAMLRAIADAVGDGELREGGTLAVQFTDTAPAKRAGMSPQKLYRAQYQPPSAAAAANDLLGAAAPAAAPALADDLL